ncbi:hypothetical protein ACSF7A_06855 [Escherichia coli]
MLRYAFVRPGTVDAGPPIATICSAGEVERTVVEEVGSLLSWI